MDREREREGEREEEKGREIEGDANKIQNKENRKGGEIEMKLILRKLRYSQTASNYIIFIRNLNFF